VLPSGKDGGPVADLGKRLRELRKRKQLSIYDVERQLGIHFSTVSKYERNERRPSLEVLREFAALYGVPLGSLLTEVEDLRELLTPDQLRWLGLLEARPELGRLLDAASLLPPERVEALVRFLEPLPPGEEPPPAP
jgi:transcriptional regulator with XRE-family HTH domain